MSDIYSIAARHAHYLEQYFNGVESKFIPFLKKVSTSLRTELLKTQTVKSEASKKAKLDYVEAIMSSQMSLFVGVLNGEINNLAEAEMEFTAKSIKKSFGLDFNLPSLAKTIAAIKARPFGTVLLKDYLSEFSKNQTSAIKNAVSTGFFEGRTTAQIVTDIIGTKAANYKDGILEVTRTSAKRMVRTALNHTYNVARQAVYDDNKDLIKNYMWVSTLDGRTSDVCRARDGKIYKVGNGPLPPAHYNCRSTTIPVFDEDLKRVNGEKVLAETDDTRASMSGQVNAGTNYNDWLKGQSEEFQNDVLGKKRAALFRKGGLSMDKFVNERGRKLTLDELKQKFPAAWGKTTN